MQMRLGRPQRSKLPSPSGAFVAGMVLGLAEFYLVPAPLLALPGLLLFAVLAWRRLDIALGLLPLTLPFWFVPKLVAGHIVFPLSEIALATCVIIALMQAVPRMGRIARHARRGAGALLERVGPWTSIGAVLLLLGTTLGVVVARRPHEALRAYRWEMVEPLVYLLLVVRYASRRGMARLLYWSLLGSAALVALLAAIQVFWLPVTFTPLGEGNRLVPYATTNGAVPRATAFIYGSGNSLGAWLARALPLALAGILALRARATVGGKRIAANGRERRVFDFVAAACCLLICLPALVWSASRGAWAGAVVGCVFVALAAGASWWRGVAVWARGRVGVIIVIAAGAVAIIAGAVVAALAGPALADALLAGHGGTGDVRLLVWQAALRMLRDHPFFGIGPDQFLYYYSPHYTSRPYWIPSLNGHPTLAAREPDLAHPHNLVLDLWLSGGLLALAGFVLACGDVARRCWRLWRAASGASAYVALGLAGVLVAMLVHGLVDNVYFAPDLAIAFWWGVALLVVLERRQRRTRAGSVRPTSRGSL